MRELVQLPMKTTSIFWPNSGLPAGSAMFEWLYPLHTGTLLGPAYRAILVLAGLVPMLSLATGFILWRTRARARQKMSPARPAR